MSETTATFCAKHPTVETSLRCNRCEKYICVKCAVKTPTGYRCKECVRSQQKVFETAEWVDYIPGFLVTGVLSTIASVGMSFVGFIGFYGFFLSFIAAPFLAGLIAEATRLATRRHRSRNLFISMAIAFGLGALPLVLLNLFFFDIFGLIYQAIYLIVGLPTFYYRLSGIQLGR